MLTRAQCEKAVTISEPTGHALDGFRTTPELNAGAPEGAAPFGARISGCGKFLTLTIRRFIFNDLQANPGLPRRQVRSPFQYLQNRAFVLLRGGRFGPSFVTIMPIGVWVCSS
jgi:hypothetical protein